MAMSQPRRTYDLDAWLVEAVCSQGLTNAIGRMGAVHPRLGELNVSGHCRQLVIGW